MPGMAKEEIEVSEGFGGAKTVHLHIELLLSGTGFVRYSQTASLVWDMAWNGHLVPLTWVPVTFAYGDILSCGSTGHPQQASRICAEKSSTKYRHWDEPEWYAELCITWQRERIAASLSKVIKWKGEHIILCTVMMKTRNDLNLNKLGFWHWLHLILLDIVQFF